ncbi:N-acetyltransferase 8-like [Pelodiscus sinensis]|uniref:N-acetyltransferase 8-like n=1 Tax=Pelodiscus sinensis TaxID=13735 RepID=UPI003F6BA1D6
MPGATAGYCIRDSHDSDRQAVRSLFVAGVRDYIPRCYWNVLTHPRTLLGLLAVSVALFLSSGSLLLALLAAPALLAAAWCLLDSYYGQFIRLCLEDDLQDIQKTYLEGEDSHFWVAESDGEVVATGGAKPSAPSGDGERTLGLARLSVRRSHRKRGIARALCRTVLRFAQQRGYKGGDSGCGIWNWEGRRLYGSLGFREIDRISPKDLVGKICEDVILCYRYDSPAGSS